jgi:hypothetical protein
MATFGKTTNGANEVAASSDAVVTSVATPSSNGTVSTMHVRCRVASGVGSQMRGVIYDTTSGALLAQTDEVTITNTVEAENVLTFSGANIISILNGTSYRIGVHWKYNAASVINVSRDATAAGRQEDYDNYADGPPATYTVESNFTGPIDVYVTYTEGATIAPNDASWTFGADGSSISQNHVIAAADAAWLFGADGATIERFRKPPTAYSAPIKPKTAYGDLLKPRTDYGSPVKPRTSYVANTSAPDGITLDSATVTLDSLTVYLHGYSTAAVPDAISKQRTVYRSTAKPRTSYR